MGEGEDIILLGKGEPFVYKRPWGSQLFLPCPYACAEKFDWMRGEQNLNEVDDKWGVLMLTNITTSTEYSCIPDGQLQFKHIFSVIAVGKF